MKQAKFLSGKDISERLNIGRTHANEILHIFGQRGQLYRFQRSLRVREDVFNAWIEEECKVDSKKHYLPANNIKRRIA